MERGTGAQARALCCPRSAPPLAPYGALGTAVAAGALPIGRAPAFPFLSATAWCYALVSCPPWLLGLFAFVVCLCGLFLALRARALVPRALRAGLFLPLCPAPLRGAPLVRCPRGLSVGSPPALALGGGSPAPSPSPPAPCGRALRASGAVAPSGER